MVCTWISSYLLLILVMLLTGTVSHNKAGWSYWELRRRSRQATRGVSLARAPQLPPGTLGCHFALPVVLQLLSELKTRFLNEALLKVRGAILSWVTHCRYTLCLQPPLSGWHSIAFAIMFLPRIPGPPTRPGGSPVAPGGTGPGGRGPSGSRSTGC